MTISQINTLTNQFNILISQYQDAYKNLLNIINSNDNSFTYVPNSAYVGANNLNTIQNSSLNDCSTSCSSTKSCSGATFNESQNTCTLSSGSGKIINSSNDIAIVKQALSYSYQLQNINNQLININNSIMELTNQNMNKYNETKKESSSKAEILHKNYNTLEQERIQIEELIRQYETLRSAQENSEVNITSNYYKYIVYFLIVLVLIMIFININLSNQQRGGGSLSNMYPYLFVLLAFIIIFNAIIKK